ncbi:oligosaccharide flippase family protein [Escherichia coli]|uniref:oligosaccharide flippase family protein n=2 Tax=Enterobacterales TaxID=91347 RepID=UPI00202DC1C5|nr:oligosaccharide flippase family protein [Escherichia coli]
MTHKLVSSDYAILMVILSNTLSSIMGVYFIYKVMNENNANDDIPRLVFIKYYIKQYAMQVFGIVTNNMDKYLIGNFTGISALGLYSTAAAFNTLPLKFYNVLSDYLFSGYVNKKIMKKSFYKLLYLEGLLVVYVHLHFLNY